MENNFKKYFLPLNDIPFGMIKSLENFDFNFVECEELRLDGHQQEFASLVWVKHIFHKTKEESLINKKTLLFGPVFSQYLSTRSKVKCILKEKSYFDIVPEELPHLRFSNRKNDFWVIKNGIYAGMYGEKTLKEKVFHLEGIHIYCDWLIKLRIVIELLKINAKKGLVDLTIDEYKKIAHLVLRHEPSLSKCSDDVFEDTVNNWIPSMVEMPLIEDIPEKYIGRIIE